MKLVAVHDLVECIATSWKQHCIAYRTPVLDDLRKNRVMCANCVCGNWKGQGMPHHMSPDPEIVRRAQEHFGLPPVPGMFDQTAGEDCS